jgi:hypothetical protein
MLTEPKTSQALELWPVNACKRAGIGYRTDLAVDFGRNAEIDQRITYGHEAGQARSGVDLTKGERFRLGKSKVRPYRHVPISSIDSVDVLE